MSFAKKVHALMRGGMPFDMSFDEALEGWQEPPQPARKVRTPANLSVDDAGAWSKPLPMEAPPTNDEFAPSDVAMHEAGHAISAVVLGHRLIEITLNSDGGGSCVSEGFDALIARGVPADRAAMQRAIVSLAGGLAHPDTRRSNSDRDNARLVIAQVGGNRQMWLEAEQRAQEILVKNRAAVRAVALTLERHGKLTGKQVANIVRGRPLNDGR